MTGAERASRGGAALFVVVAGASFSTSSPLSRWARPADPLFIAFGRLALAALVLLALDARDVGPSIRALTGRQRVAVVGAGALLAAHFAAFQWGLDHTSLPAAASLVSLEPISVVAMFWALFGIRPRPVEQIALVVASGGAAVIGSASGVGEHRLVGDAAVLVAVLLFGGYLAIARGLRSAMPTRSYVAVVYASAAAFLALLLPLVEAAHPAAIAALPGRSFLGIALLALVPTVVGHTAVQAASRTLRPSIVALASPAETLGAITLAAALLGELPTSRELVGGALIPAGTIVALLTAPGS